MKKYMLSFAIFLSMAMSFADSNSERKSIDQIIKSTCEQSVVIFESPEIYVCEMTSYDGDESRTQCLHIVTLADGSVQTSCKVILKPKTNVLCSGWYGQMNGCTN